MLRIYVDAATKGNPGPSGGGIVILGEQLNKQLHICLENGSNHEAEFQVFLYALEWLIENNFTQEAIVIHTDSKVVAQTIEKNYVKNPIFLSYLKKYQQLEPLFSLLLIKWIPEKQNKGADALARQALKKYH